MEQITYTQSKGIEPFDWNTFLDKLDYTEVELIQASNLADSWVTCACGTQCARLPRDARDRPFDGLLVELGTDFMDEIDNMKYHSWEDNPDLLDKSRKKARQILHRIEQRSAQLLKELDNQKEAS